MVYGVIHNIGISTQQTIRFVLFLVWFCNFQIGHIAYVSDDDSHSDDNTLFIDDSDSDSDSIHFIDESDSDAWE